MRLIRGTFHTLATASVCSVCGVRVVWCVCTVCVECVMCVVCNCAPYSRQGYWVRYCAYLYVGVCVVCVRVCV